MKYIEAVIMLPVAMAGLLIWMVIDLIRMLQGKQTVDEEWHDIYVYGNMNHGQGRKRNERISERGEIDDSNME